MRAFVALYDGRCALCDRPIYADEDHIANLNEEYVHAECAEDEGYEVEYE